MSDNGFKQGCCTADPLAAFENAPRRIDGTERVMTPADSGAVSQ
jgi:hypothetical protein